jgi:hypothetical protein
MQARALVRQRSGLLVQVEGIGIEHRRETRAVCGQRLGRDGGGDHLFALADSTCGWPRKSSTALSPA